MFHVNCFFSLLFVPYICSLLLFFYMHSSSFHSLIFSQWSLDEAKHLSSLFFKSNITWLIFNEVFHIESIYANTHLFLSYFFVVYQMFFNLLILDRQSGQSKCIQFWHYHFENNKSNWTDVSFSWLCSDLCIMFSEKVLFNLADLQKQLSIKIHLFTLFIFGLQLLWFVVFFSLVKFSTIVGMKHYHYL